MNQKNWKTYAFWILLSEATGILAGWLTREGIEIYSQTVEKPFLTPPAIVFPIVWTILYALMGIGAARISLHQESEKQPVSISLFVTQLVVNFFWSLFFFNLQAFGFSFFWLVLLWLMIIAMILSFRQVDPLAAWLQVPYLIWVTFAGYLNLGVWLLNR